jgi:arsenate reductase-like glutaredoxin family protein
MRRIDWMYFRKSCVTCKRAKAYLDEHGASIADTTDAIKIRKGRDEALELARSVDTIVVARGKKVVVFDMKSDPPDDDVIVAHLIGPTGNLRAPTARVGKTLCVGFNDEAYAKLR